MFTTTPALPVPESPQETASAPVSPTLETSRKYPLFKTLSPAECESVLVRNSVGRIAFAVHDRVSILPIHYVFEDGWIYGRTTSAGKLRDILRNRRIAFEVDEHAEAFEWRSVIVRGPLYVVQVHTPRYGRGIYKTALSAIRRLVPATLTESDPAPFRDQLFRIRAVEVTGRASLPFGGQREFGPSASAVTETAEPDEDAVLRDRAQRAIAALGVPENGDLHVDAFDGILVLSGRVETSRDRQALEAAILKVPAVIALVEEVETIFPPTQEPLPTDLARAAVSQLRLEPSVLGPGMKVVVEHGWLRLEGAAMSQRSRDEAVRRMRAVKGARGVLDRLRVAGPATELATAD